MDTKPAKEYEVVLNTEGGVVVMQFPLLSSRPNIKEVRGKLNNSYMEADIGHEHMPKNEKKMREHSQFGAAQKNISIESPLRSDYYIFRTKGGTVYGEKVEKIMQFHPSMDFRDPPEEEPVAERKGILHVKRKETPEEHGYRRKDPNLLLGKLESEDYVNYALRKEPPQDFEDLVGEALSERDGGGELHDEPASSAPEKRSRETVERLRATIRNVCVVNLDVLSDIYKTLSEKTIKSCLQEMTFRFKGRFLLRRKFLDEKAQRELGPLLSRFQESPGDSGSAFIQFSEGEQSGLREGLLLLLDKMCRKEGSKYFLKGDCEQIEGLQETCEEQEGGANNVDAKMADSTEKIVSLLNTHHILSYDAIKRRLDTPDIDAALKDEVFMCLRGRFVLRHIGPSIDLYRAPVLRLFSARESVKKSEVFSAVQAETGKSIPHNTYMKLMRELCIAKGAAWFLREGNEDPQ